MRWSLSDIWNNVRFFEIASALSTLILIFGAVLEEWPKLKQIMSLTAKLILFRSSVFERCVLKKLVIHSFGAIMVVAGIAGELLFETRTFILEDRGTETLSTEVGRAKQSANDAAVAARLSQSSANAANLAAGTAQQKADMADITSGKAQDEANAVAAKAAELDRQLGATKKDLDTAKSQLADAEADEKKEEQALTIMEVCNAPRVIPFWSIGDAKTSVDPLKPFAGRHAIVEFVPNDAEARRAALNISGALDKAGWNVDSITPQDGIEDGVAVQAHFTTGLQQKEMSPEQKEAEWLSEGRASKAADAVIDFLHSYNWQANRSWPDPNTSDIPRDGIKIRLGLYPATTYVTPPGAKDLAEAVAQTETKWREIDKKMEEGEQREHEEKLKHLTPQQASDFRAMLEQYKAEMKKLGERHSGPCQPLNSLTPRLDP